MRNPVRSCLSEYPRRGYRQQPPSLRRVKKRRERRGCWRGRVLWWLRGGHHGNDPNSRKAANQFDGPPLSASWSPSRQRGSRDYGGARAAIPGRARLPAPDRGLAHNSTEGWCGCDTGARISKAQRGQSRAAGHKPLTPALRYVSHPHHDKSFHSEASGATPPPMLAPTPRHARRHDKKPAQTRCTPKRGLCERCAIRWPSGRARGLRGCDDRSQHRCRQGRRVRPLPGEQDDPARARRLLPQPGG